MPMEYKGKVALITGGARGLGKSFSEVLLERGCNVAVLGVRVPNGEAVVETFNKQYGSGSSIFIKCDISSEKEFEDAFKKAYAWKGHLDIVVNNAGIMDESRWKKVVDINLSGTIQGTRLAFQYMGKDKGGQGGVIVNVSSVAGLRPVYWIPVYSATKYGIVGLSRCYGTPPHFERTGVRVVAICPGAVKTDILPEKDEMYFPEHASELMKRVKFMQPSYVADGMIHVLEEDMNGAVLEITNEGYRIV